MSAFEQLQQELRKIPPVTRALVLGTLAVTIPCMLQLVAPYKIIFHWGFISKRWEIWRLLTCFLYGGDGFNFLFSLIMLYRHSNSLEEAHFHKDAADYTFALILCALGIIGLNVKLGGMIFFKPLLMSILYLEAQANPHQTINLYGFISMKSLWFPWAMVGMDVLFGGPAAGMQSLTGIMVAHAYWYLTQVYPRNRNGRQLLNTPPLLKRWLSPQAAGVQQGGYTVGGGVRGYAPARPAAAATAAQARASSSSSAAAAQQPPAQPSANSSAHSWGSGQKLGN